MLGGKDARTIRAYFNDPNNETLFRPAEPAMLEEHNDGQVYESDDVPF